MTDDQRLGLFLVACPVAVLLGGMFLGLVGRVMTQRTQSRK